MSYVVPSDQSYTFTRADTGHEICRLLWANGGLITEHLGVLKPEQVSNNCVLVQTWPTGRLMFVERERLKEYGPPGMPKMPEPDPYARVFGIPMDAAPRADKAGE